MPTTTRACSTAPDRRGREKFLRPATVTRAPTLVLRATLLVSLFSVPSAARPMMECKDGTTHEGSFEEMAALMARQSTVDCQITSAALSRSQVRRRSEDVRDEMRLFGSCGSRDQPPTQRTRPTTCGHKLRQKPTPAAHESDDPSSRSLEGRACGDSPRHQQKRPRQAVWNEMCSSHGAPGASQPKARATVVGRARSDSLAEDSTACWVPMRSSLSASGASKLGAAQASAARLSPSPLSA
jgi:hypothetical protein